MIHFQKDMAPDPDPRLMARIERKLREARWMFWMHVIVWLGASLFFAMFLVRQAYSHHHEPDDGWAKMAVFYYSIIGIGGCQVVLLPFVVWWRIRYRRLCGERDEWMG